ncbi:MAG: hypothetical protein E3J72_10375 [Planctomycetota bacterium]|nr:MAG: hypothetical protein E3J72_10375 [Planctomycetota bacterium]
MSKEEREKIRAIEVFNKWVGQLRIPAKNVKLGDVDPPARIHEPFYAEEVADVFLALHSEQVSASYRQDILDRSRRIEDGKVWLVRNLWEAEKARVDNDGA